MNILIFRGKPKYNGITVSLMNLLKALDYDKVHVTLLLVRDRRYDGSKLLSDLDKRVEVIWKNTSFVQAVTEQIIRKTGIPFEKTAFFKGLLKKDRDRLFGNREFDTLIDYDGYNLYYDLLLLSMRGRKLLWLHNDMYGEMTRRSPWLKKNFTVYNRFDKVVSCGEGVSKVNREMLSDRFKIDKDRFVYVNNLSDDKKVLEMAEKAAEVQAPGDKVTFVTVGRCSVEKNHKTLIRAFAEFHKEYKNTALLILGDGPDLTEEKELAEKEAGASIIMPGTVNNPYSVMKKCSCFILPSLHEGMPMVVPEARTLGLPIILGDFSTVSGCSLEDGQLIVHNDKDGIIKGLKAFMKGEVPTDYKYNGAEQNKEALSSFYSMIG